MRKAIYSTLVMLAGCSSASPRSESLGDRHPRADEHLEAAHAHARRAAGLTRWLDARRGPDAQIRDRSGLWYTAWETARDDVHQTQVHLAAVADLRATYERACAGIPASEVGVSPIERHAVDTIATRDGAIVLLSANAGPADRLVSAMRCHRAWMMLGEATMTRCALDLAGLDVVAYGDGTGISVELTVDDPTLVPELQRRAAREVERARQNHARAKARP